MATGGEVLVETLLASGVDVCFANPGTSEMHFVSALDRHPEMRCVLCLFEGGVSGAADGYARMSGNVAATLFHLAPGFGNGWSNIHNARKGGSGMVNVVGDHPDIHLNYDAPLQADLEGIVRSVSHWQRRVSDAAGVAADGAAAVRAARSKGGQIATLILHADAAWSNSGAVPVTAPPLPPLHRPEPEQIAAAAAALARPGAALLVGGPALYGDLAETAGRIAARCGCRLISSYFAPRIVRGAEAVAIEMMRYLPGPNAEFLSGLERIVCLGAAPPVNFFAYPGLPSTPEPPGCAIDRLCFPGWDVAFTLDELAAAVGVDGSEDVARISGHVPDLAEGPLTMDGVGRALARHLPDEAVVVNEAVTGGFEIWPHVDTAARHDRINTTGGSIGQCLPAATGAAIACPDRSVFAVSGDGSAMYQIQSLWTMAREELDVTTVILSNGGYRILHLELENLGLPAAGRNARRMFDMHSPAIDWLAMARGHGVAARRAETTDALAEALDAARNTPGPSLIEAVIHPG